MFPTRHKAALRESQSRAPACPPKSQPQSATPRSEPPPTPAPARIPSDTAPDPRQNLRAQCKAATAHAQSFPAVPKKRPERRRPATPVQTESSAVQTRPAQSPQPATHPAPQKTSAPPPQSSVPAAPNTPTHSARCSPAASAKPQFFPEGSNRRDPAAPLLQYFARKPALNLSKGGISLGRPAVQATALEIPAYC